MIEFVTFLPLEVKSCRLSHLSGSLKWLWHPLGHVSLKLIFFKICQVPLRDGVDSQQASTITKHSMCKRHLRNFLWGAKGLQTLWHIERVLLLRNWLLAIDFFLQLCYFGKHFKLPLFLWQKTTSTIIKARNKETEKMLNGIILWFINSNNLPLNAVWELVNSSIYTSSQKNKTLDKWNLIQIIAGICF